MTTCSPPSTHRKTATPHLHFIQSADLHPPPHNASPYTRYYITYPTIYSHYSYWSHSMRQWLARSIETSLHPRRRLRVCMSMMPFHTVFPWLSIRWMNVMWGMAMEMLRLQLAMRGESQIWTASLFPPPVSAPCLRSYVASHTLLCTFLLSIVLLIGY
jgi:hypothetical protein